MIRMAWTALVDELDPIVPKDRAELWESLVEKAQNPLDYVPAITECRVLEHYPDGFLREIVRDGKVLRQRVTPTPMDRIVFRHLDDPEVVSITNIIGTDDAERLTFTIEVELAAGGIGIALAQSEFLRATDDYFIGTLGAIMGALRPLAGQSGQDRTAFSTETQENLT